jgi:hypothetical protein
MRICITGGHSELVYDMILMFQRLGHDVVCVGGMPDHKRDKLPNCDWKRSSHESLHRETLKYLEEFPGDYHPPYIMGDPSKNQPSIYDWMIKRGLGDAIEDIAEDVDVFYGFIPRILGLYYKHKPMIWQMMGGEHRSYLAPAKEVSRHGGRVVCHSEKNAALLDNQFPVIHFYKDPDEFCDWTGDEEAVLYVANVINQRKDACQLKTFMDTKLENRWYLAGTGNSDFFGSRAKEFSYSEYKKKMRDCRLYYNLGTVPVPYTMAPIEAAMTGMPVLTGDYIHPPVNVLPQYQVPELLGEGCMITDSKFKINALLKTKWGLKKMSDKARDNAIHHFGIENVSKKWKKLLDGIEI